MDVHFGCRNVLGSGIAALLMALIEEVAALLRRSPAPDDDRAAPARFSGHDAPVFLPPPR